MSKPIENLAFRIWMWSAAVAALALLGSAGSAAAIIFPTPGTLGDVCFSDDDCGPGYYCKQPAQIIAGTCKPRLIISTPSPVFPTPTPKPTFTDTRPTPSGPVDRICTGDEDCARHEYCEIKSIAIGGPPIVVPDLGICQPRTPCFDDTECDEDQYCSTLPVLELERRAGAALNVLIGAGMCFDLPPEPSPTAQPTPPQPTATPPPSPPTQAPTQAPTEVPTQAPTEVPTEAPTEVPTEAPTAPTEAPTAPTEAPAEATEVPTKEPTATPTIQFTLTPTWTPIPDDVCHGDCNGDGVVSIGELIRLVAIALDEQPMGACEMMADLGSVSIGDLIHAVANSLEGCAGA